MHGKIHLSGLNERFITFKGELNLGVVERTELRGKYGVNVYDVEITDEMRQTALEFATKIITEDNQYSRLAPEVLIESNDLDSIQKVEIQRTYVGKLGELCFSKLLTEKGKKHDVKDMFTIYEGQHNVDSYDFFTSDEKTVDVKTGFRENHTRLLVNRGQFEGSPKDYYVGVKLNARDLDPKKKLVYWDNITIGTVEGYADYSYLNTNVRYVDYGEGDAKGVSYRNLMSIDKLISKF